MIGFFWVGLGGAIGAMLRYGAGLAALRLWGANFPWGTLAVNISGSLLIGLITGYLLSLGNELQETVRLFVIVGILGGFTTFSAFALDSIILLQKGEYLPAIAYIGGSVLFSIFATALGLMVTKVFV